ncbi:MAG: AAA family ATPase [Bacteroidota bacterium]|nr:AAA family ATPase [Bacteroidota bacterium]
MNISLACTTEFMAAQAKLPKGLQKKVREFFSAFRLNPTAPGFNFERINGAASQNLRSVRIDQKYRAIVQQSRRGQTLICLWVDNHEQAYDWARKYKCAVHPDTGAIQIFSTEHVRPPGSEHGNTRKAGGLFAHWKDRQLQRLGVPRELMELVRTFEAVADLNRHAEALPVGAYVTLSDLADGADYEALVRDLQAYRDDLGDDDFDEALKDTKNRRDFVVIDDDESLKAMLEAPLGEWRIYLHPMQQRLVDMQARGPIRVLGGAGTGKTVVAMHRAKRLVSEVFNQPEDRVLFLMYSKNLVADISANLRKMCTPEEFKRIKVTNIDAWVTHQLYRRELNERIAYDDAAAINRAWNGAIDCQDEEVAFTKAFIKAEFRDVILAHGIETEEEYLAIPRKGRGKPLRRADRKILWPVFEIYRELLADQGLYEREDAMRRLRKSIEPGSYRSIIVDEAQDLSAEAMRLIRAMVQPGDNDMLIVGDAHQRIFGKPIVLSQCGIHIRGRSRRLRINYRTPEEIRACAVGVLEDIPYRDLDGSLASVRGYRSLISGAHPLIRNFASGNEEIDFVEQYIQQLNVGDSLHRICLVAPTNYLVNRYEGILEYKGIAVYSIKPERGDDLSVAGVRTGTMHRVKGLEFDHMIAVGVDSTNLPHRGVLKGASNAAAKEEIIRKARSLLYVVCTRARKTLCITSHGTPSPLIQDLNYRG